MTSVVGRPHPALAGLVDRYVGFREDLDPRAIHHGLPSTTVTVILAFDEPLDVEWHGGRQRFWTLAGALHTRPAIVHTHGFQHGIQLGLSPMGVRLLLGLTAGDLRGANADHELLPGGVDRATHARITQAPDWPARFGLLDECLLGVLARASRPPVPDDLAEAWRLVVAGGGRLGVDALAARVGWSRRHLSTRFRAEFGVTPKEALRLARFERAHRLAGAGMPLGDVAAAAGYADQAHLTREWRGFAGRPPAATLAEVFPIVQDEGDATVGTLAA
ncbi:MAG: AraC family transcriptional regulator [Thermoleophilia bacterium]|nr:AraC family transcriptional regulator [Thermoleophilia bacterium]